MEGRSTSKGEKKERGCRKLRRGEERKTKEMRKDENEDKTLPADAVEGN